MYPVNLLLHCCSPSLISSISPGARVSSLPPSGAPISTSFSPHSAGQSLLSDLYSIYFSLAPADPLLPSSSVPLPPVCALCGCPASKVCAAPAPAAASAAATIITTPRPPPPQSPSPSPYRSSPPPPARPARRPVRGHRLSLGPRATASTNRTPPTDSTHHEIVEAGSLVLSRSPSPSQPPRSRFAGRVFPPAPRAQKLLSETARYLILHIRVAALIFSSATAKFSSADAFAPPVRDSPNDPVPFDF